MRVDFEAVEIHFQIKNFEKTQKAFIAFHKLFHLRTLYLWRFPLCIQQNSRIHLTLDDVGIKS